MTTKANSQLMDLKGNAYLKVAGRVQAFREAHPTGVITTELISTEPRIIVRATVHAADGTLISSGYGTAPVFGKGMNTWQGKELEKAETAAVGRALGFAGFGTLAAFADDDADNLADSPIEPLHKSAPHGHEWTGDEFQTLRQQAAQMAIPPENVLGVLGVGRIRDYAPGPASALEMLKAHAAARAANIEKAAQS